MSKRKIEALERRAAYLRLRVAAGDADARDLSYDKAELSALLWALERLPGERQAEVRLNDDGSLDEVVGKGEFHLEQMDNNHWWMCLGGVHVWLHARGKITASYEDEFEGTDKTSTGSAVESP